MRKRESIPFITDLSPVTIISFVLVILGAIIVFFPIFWMVLTSLKHPYEIHRKTLTFWLDNFFYLRNYAHIFTAQPFARFF